MVLNYFSCKQHNLIQADGFLVRTAWRRCSAHWLLSLVCLPNASSLAPTYLPVSRKGVVFLLTVIILSSVFWSPRFHFLKHLVLSNSFIIIFSPSTYSSPQHLRKYSFKPFKSSKATLHLFSSPLPCHYHHQKSYYAFHGPHTLVSLQKLSKFSTTSS